MPVQHVRTVFDMLQTWRLHVQLCLPEHHETSRLIPVHAPAWSRPVHTCSCCSWHEQQSTSGHVTAQYAVYVAGQAAGNTRAGVPVGVPPTALPSLL